ncbi:MAG: two-component system, OmpR family, response regulator [Nocardioidaceae bacterium]|nr:two-component system, OmpR family, response regulator [Nocardioidaceae bacterium]
MMSVLVVEDNPSVASVLQRGLEREGYSVDLATDGTEALAMGIRGSYVAIVLDVMIPAPDGLTVVRRLRQRGCWVPVLMLTARDRVEDRIAGLHAGADDYLGKPFSVRELTARLHALSRRASFDRPNVLRAGDIELDPMTREARRGAVSVPLSSREFDLLAEFMRHAGELLADPYLADHVLDAEPQRVAFYVERLRDKLDLPFGRTVIQRVEGAGYRLDPDA